MMTFDITGVLDQESGRGKGIPGASCTWEEYPGDNGIRLRSPDIRVRANQLVVSLNDIVSSELLTTIRQSNASIVFGYPDDLKLRSCMTLFQAADPDCGTFQAVLDKFFGGKPDERTLRILKNQESGK